MKEGKVKLLSKNWLPFQFLWGLTTLQKQPGFSRLPKLLYSQNLKAIKASLRATVATVHSQAPRNTSPSVPIIRLGNGS